MKTKKACSKCGIVKKLDQFGLEPRFNVKDGRRADCKACRYQRYKERYDADPEFRKKINARQLEAKKKRLETDPEYRETLKGYARKGYEKNKEKLKAQKRDRYASDPEYRAMRQKQSREYKRRVRAAAKASRLTDKETPNGKDN